MRYVVLGGADCALAGARAALGAFVPRDAVFARIGARRDGDGDGDGDDDDADDDATRGTRGGVVVRDAPRGAVACVANGCAFVAINDHASGVDTHDDASSASASASASAVMAMDIVSYIARALDGDSEGEVCAVVAARDETLTEGAAYEDATNGSVASAASTGIIQRALSDSGGVDAGIVVGDATLTKVVRALVACGVKTRVVYAHGYGAGAAFDARAEDDALAVTDRLCRAVEASAFGVAAKLKYDASRVRELKTVFRARRDDSSELYM